MFNDLALTATVHLLNVPVPATASPGSTYARFRLTTGTTGSTNSNSPTGAAGVGEVEDYKVVISTTTAVSLRGLQAWKATLFSGCWGCSSARSTL